MDIFKITVEVENRNLDVVAKAGVLATVETGSHVNKVVKPEHKVRVIVGEGKAGLTAWVQVVKIDAANNSIILNEGWIGEGNGSLAGFSSVSASFASLVRVKNPSADMMKCQQDTEFGIMACCTSYGNGCYVQCCNSCCSDSTRCPGASCCS